MTTSRQLLARILDTPQLVEAVRSLHPRALGAVVERVGLEDAAEILALATTEQLLHVFDEMLWTSDAPGRDERLDPDRFAVWLEVMLEAGEAFLSASLRELPEELVAAAFAGQVWVLDLATLEQEVLSAATDDAALTEKALDSCLCQEFDDYLVISRHHDGWDAVLTALLALAHDDYDYARALLASCHRASTETIEDNGTLYDVLTSAEMLEADAAAQRDDRRTRQGHVMPSTAASFLELARVTALSELVASDEPDPVTRMHFRHLETGRQKSARAAAATPTSTSAPAKPATRLLHILRKEGVVVSPRPLLPTVVAQCPLRTAMQELVEHDFALHARRMEELAYVANVLLAGADQQGRRLRPAEAADTAIGICTEALTYLLNRPEASGSKHGQGRAAQRTPTEVLRDNSIDKLFRIGWHLRDPRQP